MKKMIIAFFSVFAILTTVSAQRGHGIVGGGYVRPRTTIIVGGGYSPYYYGGWGLGYGYPYGYYPSVVARPSQLDQKIADINHDYSERIESVRMNRDISGKERRHEIRTLKEERDRAIDLARRNYYRS